MGDSKVLELKKWTVNQHLEEEAMLKKSVQEIYKLRIDAQKKMIQAADGQKKWDTLPETTKAG